jgi:hypothetical protein
MEQDAAEDSIQERFLFLCSATSANEIITPAWTATSAR